jgi:hypothetical protein
MPLRLNVGVSRKLGLPEYSSVGASCNIDVELDSSLLQTDLDGFHTQVRDAFVAAQQAVNDELTRLQMQPASPAAASAHGPGRRNGSGTPSHGGPARNGATNGRPVKPATPNQVRAILAIARRQNADLEGLLRDEYGVDRPEDLNVSEASTLIDQLKAVSER